MTIGHLALLLIVVIVPAMLLYGSAVVNIVTTPARVTAWMLVALAWACSIAIVAIWFIVTYWSVPL